MRIASFLCCCVLCAHCISAGEAVMDVKPRRLVLTVDSSDFVSARIKVLNRGGTPITITKIDPSCACGSATILKNPVQPLDVAELALRVNTINMHDTLNTVEFSIESNAENSPYVFSVQVKKPRHRNDTVPGSHP